MLQISKVLYACVFTYSLNAQDTIKQPDKNKKGFSVVNLFDNELIDQNGEATNTSGLFSASDDIYLNTISFDFQGVFYKARGLDPENVTFLLNGVNQNRLYDSRPAWNNWSGVDGIYRNQVINEPLASSEKTFGNALGVISLTTQPSKYRAGTRVSYARSNRSYQNKTAINHTGTFSKSWYYTISASRRWGNQGYKQGTFYDANSLLLSIEKQLSKFHSITTSFLYTPNRRGTTGFYTDEVLNLKDNTYNGNWGFQNGKKRNARVRTVKEPILLFTHSYVKLDKIRWQNSLFLQKGTSGYSRIDYNGGNNPDPTYYQKLPSYWLSRNRIDFENVYRYQQDFENNGQLNWDFLYQSNVELKANNQSAAYLLYSDKRDESRIQFNSNITQKINNAWKLNASLDYRNTFSDNYAEALDLLGGNNYLDVASFTQAQSDLNHPNREIQKGDRFKYNYKINSSHLNGFAQINWKGKKVEISNAIGFTYSAHQRNGKYNYENESNSIGKSDKVKLSAFQGKLNALYKFSNRNLVSFKTAYIQKAPNVKQLFPNARVSNITLDNVDPQNLFSNSFSYVYRGIKHRLKFTGYYNLQSNETTSRFYFAEGFGTDANDVENEIDTSELLDENSLFVLETLNGIKKQHIGIELGTSYDITSSIKLIGVLGLGDYRYNNNPNLILYTENSNTARNLGFTNSKKNLGTSSIKGKKLSSGPQQAFSLKLAYSDPSYWRINVSVNHFRNNYVGIAPIKHTSNFIQEINGNLIKNLDTDLVRRFRTQEQLTNFTLINLSGGKSWLLKKGYLSFYWNVQNVLNINYRTGGFTSSRAANYSEQLKEHNRETALFGNRYFTGNGRVFFTGIYYSF